MTVCLIIPPPKLETYYYIVISQIIKLTIKSHYLNHFNDQEFTAYIVKKKIKSYKTKNKIFIFVQHTS